MATLDDKLLGEKLDYYCSSSEDERDDEDDDQGKNDQDERSVEQSEEAGQTEVEINPWEGSSTNTGPKGVLKDYQRFKQLEKAQREENERERLALAKKFAFTCQSKTEEEAQKAKDQELEDEFSEIMSDPFFQRYVQQRMNEMFKQQNQRKKFQTVHALKDGTEFLEAVDNEDKTVTVIILLHESGSSACITALESFRSLCRDYPLVKWCTLKASSVGSALSHKFSKAGVPAILVYKEGNIMHNFVRFTVQLGEDFCTQDLENFLIEHGVLEDRTLIPSAIRNGADEDSD